MQIRKLFAYAGLVTLGLLLLSGLPGARAAGQGYRPTDEASVKIDFQGMIGVFFGRTDVVSVGILNAQHHTPLLTITKFVNGVKGRVTEIKAAQLAGSLFFDVDGQHQGISRYQPAGKLSVSDPNDFRHVLDFNALYPDRKLTINESKLHGKVHIRAGLFYASNLTDTPVKFFSANNSGKVLPVSRRMADPEGKIFLRDGESLVISGSQIETIRLVAAEGVRWEIAITNLPPEDMTAMDHFLNYYGIVNEKLDRYIPVQSFKATYAPTPLICGELTFTDNSLTVP